MSHPFDEVGPFLDSGPFDYDDEAAWRSWLNEIDGDRVRRFNGRTVWCLAPVGWEP